MLYNSFKQYVLAAGALALAACGGKQEAPRQGPPPAVFVTVEKVRTTDAVFHDEYPGTLVALNQTELRSQVSGYVTGVYFTDGQKVSKGQRLYSIDAQIYNANVQNAVANLQVQEANMLKAQRDAERYRELDKQDAIAKQQVDYAEAALQVAQKQVAAAKATINALRANVSFATIYAPFSGTIGISLVKTGTAVVAGQTILNTVSTDNPMAVDFNVNQQDIYRFMQLQQTGGSKNDSTFSIAFDTAVYPYYGKINLIDRAVDPQTGTIKMRLSFPNDKSILKSGMTTTVRVLNAGGGQQVLIPYKAVTEQLGEFFVYVVGDSSKVSQRRVSLGRQLGTDVVIKQGLKAGEPIVTQGVQNLREGAVITTTAPKPAAPAGK